MSASIDIASPSQETDSGAVIARFLGRRELSVLLLLLAIVQQSLGHHNADNSWLFTVCDKLLDGARPYVDVIETNPPASFLLYMPAVALARLLGLPAEFVVSSCVFAGALASIFLSGQILRVAGLLRSGDAMLAGNAALFAFVLLPGFSFAEREHIAAIAILPILAVYAARAAGAQVVISHALGAGLLAGLTMAIKPHFALAVGLPLLLVLSRHRSLRPAFAMENLVGAAIVMVYIAAVFAYFPAFFDVLPSILDAYVPVKEPLRILLVHPWFLINLAMLAALIGVARGRCLAPPVAMLMLSSCGFLGAFVVQGKGWVNHGLPGVALTFLAMSLVIAPALGEVAARRAGEAWSALRRLVLFVAMPAALGLPILFGMTLQWTMREEYPGLREAVLAHAPRNPKIISLSADLDVGHPLVRRVNGVWVGQTHTLWLMLCAQLLIDAKRGDPVKLAAYVDADARMFANNVRASAPDVILVSSGETIEQMMRRPEISAVMQEYERVAKAEDVAVWTPKRRAPDAR